MIETLPKKIQDHLQILNKAYKKEGYSLYLVGGAIRDYMLGEKIKDFDMATNAPLEITKKIFKNVIPTGEDFGTLTVLLNEEEYEITRFRKDLETDGRRATVIEYADTIEEDLSRRDFTINALAYDIENKQIIDVVNGIEDIKNKKLKFVGNAKRRIEEDNLRSMRFFRFLQRYKDFKATKEDLQEIKEHTNLEKLSIERIFQELNKMISYKNPPKSIVIKGLEEIKLFDKLKIKNKEGILQKVLETNSLIPIFIQKRKEQKEGDKEVWEEYKTSRKQTKEIIVIFDLIEKNKSKNSKILIKSILQNTQNIDLILSVLDITEINITKEFILKCSKEPIKISDLEITSQELINSGLQGNQISSKYEEILKHIWLYPKENTNKKIKRKFLSSAKKVNYEK